MNDLSFDSDGEYIGSCSDDGLVVINGLFIDESFKFVYHRPMRALALDPGFSRMSSRRFVTGGLAGHLILNSKTWLGNRDKVFNLVFYFLDLHTSPFSDEEPFYIRFCTTAKDLFKLLGGGLH